MHLKCKIWKNLAEFLAANIFSYESNFYFFTNLRDKFMTSSEAFDIVLKMTPEEILDAPDDSFLEYAFCLLEE